MILKKGERGEYVELLQRKLAILGYYTMSVDGIFGSGTEAALKKFQKDSGEPGTGVVSMGDNVSTSWTELDEDVCEFTEKLLKASAMKDSDVGLLEPDIIDSVPVGDFAGKGKAAIEAGALEWSKGVHEPPGTGWEEIDKYIRGGSGLHWTWEKAYTKNNQFAWCGAFVSYCYGKVGLKLDIRESIMPSTYRIYKWAKDTERFVKPLEVREGDVVIVGPKGAKEWGNHITLCTGVSAEGVDTVEGNGTGVGPDGTRYEGVVHGHHPFDETAPKPRTYRVMYGIRFLKSDFE